MSVFALAINACIARNLGQRITFPTLFEPVVDINVGYIMMIQVGSTVFLGLLVLYLWPLTIDFDPENPIPWYYFVTCSYWKGENNPIVDDPEAVGAGALGGNPGASGLIKEQ